MLRFAFCSPIFLGKHPEDIYGVVRQAAEALHWCSYLFHEMKKWAEDEAASKHPVANLGEIKTLISMGSYISFD
ncbi:MAG: hypothetical protein LBB76_08895, partial [Azoarcus sp.]|nr:hypothetical protein [Azoarcus sp.]